MRYLKWTEVKKVYGVVGQPEGKSDIMGIAIRPVALLNVVGYVISSQTSLS